MDCPIRGSEDILVLLEHAKLDQNELVPVTQTLNFSPDYGDDKTFELLEVDSELLDFLNTGERLAIRGDPDDSSVICTSDKTFEIREAETSNSLLLIPNLLVPTMRKEEELELLPKQVASIHYKYYEMKQCQPRIKKLNTQLENCPYKGGTSTSYGYKWNELLSVIQASEKELQEGLKKLKAYSVQDRWCLLDFDYHFGVLSSILNHIDENSLPLTGIHKQEIISNLKSNEPESILEQCFEYFFTPIENGGETNVMYKIIEKDVSQFCAEVLLKSAGKFNLQEFLNIWQQSVPEGVRTHLSQLKGLALVDRESSPPIIWHFPAFDLPSDISKVFSILFDTQRKWTYEEILPYIQEFTTSKQGSSALLTKYTRTSVIDGVKYFTARHKN